VRKRDTSLGLTNNIGDIKTIKFNVQHDIPNTIRSGKITISNNINGVLLKDAIDHIDLFLARAGFGGVEMAKHHFRLTCNLVKKYSNMSTKVLARLTRINRSRSMQMRAHKKALGLSKLIKHELSNQTYSSILAF
jgi:hypothetical protein